MTVRESTARTITKGFHFSAKMEATFCSILVQASRISFFLGCPTGHPILDQFCRPTIIFVVQHAVVQVLAIPRVQPEPIPEHTLRCARFRVSILESEPLRHRLEPVALVLVTPAVVGLLGAPSPRQTWGTRVNQRRNRRANGNLRHPHGIVSKRTKNSFAPSRIRNAGSRAFGTGT